MRLLYTRAPIAQATVVVNASITAWVFRDLVNGALLVTWLAMLFALAALRMRLVSAYRRSGAGPSETKRWAFRFTAEAGLTGIAWGVAAILFYMPLSLVHQVFLAFVLGGMTAGAASSNASYTPAFVAFAAPALLPMVVRLSEEREPIHAAMAFMLTLFGVAMSGISRTGSRAVEHEIHLRLENEALVEDLTSVRQRLENLNENLERRVNERTSEIIHAHEALREADRRKEEFLAVLSHELRNPLAPIRNSLYLLDHAAPESEHARRAKEVVRRQTEHLTRLVDDLLDVTRISRGKIVLKRTRVDLHDIVRKTTDDLRSVFAQAGVELHVDDMLDPAWITADPTRITQVLGNLLHNAVKFTPAGGAVTVSLVAKGACAEICVRDTGVGMEPEAVEHMFEPFVQAEMTLARTKGGLGLGLPLVKGLVELHGGTVEARSGGVGRGAEFIVRLPLAELATEAGHERHAAADAKARAILVIEDNLDAGETLADILELQGHRVRVARDGRSGLKLARELRPDVVLCDIGLPDIDGYEVARALRREDTFRATRLVALSGYAQPEDQQRARDAGFDAHVAKPPDIDELAKLL